MSSPSTDSPVLLAAGPHGLELRFADDRPGRGARLEVDWLRHALRHDPGAIRRDPLIRALGRRSEGQGTETQDSQGQGPVGQGPVGQGPVGQEPKGQSSETASAGSAAPIGSASPVPWVVDATAGFGHDALHLAAAGCRVLAIERNALVAAMLEDGLRRLRDDSDLGEMIRRIELRHAESIEVLEELARDPNPLRRPEVVLLDPMFPPRARHRSALPPKPMQILRRLLGSDADTLALLGAARRAATRRVIVKRADDGPPLGGSLDADTTDGRPSATSGGPLASLGGRTVRFDIYSSAGRPADVSADRAGQQDSKRST